MLELHTGTAKSCSARVLDWWMVVAAEHHGPQPYPPQKNSEGLDGSATAEERDNYHRDAYENARNHASGPPAARG